MDALVAVAVDDDDELFAPFVLSYRALGQLKLRPLYSLKAKFSIQFSLP